MFNEKFTQAKEDIKKTMHNIEDQKFADQELFSLFLTFITEFPKCKMLDEVVKCCEVSKANE